MYENVFHTLLLAQKCDTQCENHKTKIKGSVELNYHYPNTHFKILHEIYMKFVTNCLCGKVKLIIICCVLTFLQACDFHFNGSVVFSGWSVVNICCDVRTVWLNEV